MGHLFCIFAPMLTEKTMERLRVLHLTAEGDADQLLQDLWRTYFKAICIRERLNPRKQLGDMPRRYWKYMTEKNGV